MQVLATFFYLVIFGAFAFESKQNEEEGRREYTFRVESYTFVL